MLGVKENLKKPKIVAPTLTNEKPSIVKASQKSDFCSFCKEKMKSGSKLNHEMTVNQILNLYSFFKKDPNSLLLVKNPTSRQANLFMEMYGEVAFMGA